jgi:hypothetical protein
MVFRVDVEQREPAARLRQGGVARDKLAQTTAIDVGDGRQIPR